jgi:hypothetical protein
MKVRKTDRGGVEVLLSGDEVATAIDNYLAASGLGIAGPRTIRMTRPERGMATGGARVYVDPSARVWRVTRG